MAVADELFFLIVKLLSISQIQVVLKWERPIPKDPQIQ
jgi:hypothetical protein